MIEINGQLADCIEVWGWPWHGRLERQSAGGEWAYYLRRHNGALWPMFSGEPSNTYVPAQLLQQWFNFANEAWAGQRYTSTHLVRVAGYAWEGRTPEQVASDRARSQEWLGEAMLTTAGSPVSLREHTLYQRGLGGIDRWIYSVGGECWLLRYDVVSGPRPGTLELGDETRPLTLRLYAKRFGLPGSPVDWAFVAEVTAPSCCTPAFSWLNPNLNRPSTLYQPQAIRSDGGRLIILAGLNAIEPGQAQSAIEVPGAFGFYELQVARSGSTWTCTLELLKKDVDLYSKAVTQADLVPANDWTGDPPEPSFPDDFTMIMPAAEPATAPAPDLAVLACEGVIEQYQLRHCGYMFDADDVLHEIQMRYRVVHSCDVNRQAFTSGGEATFTRPTISDPYTLVTDTRWQEELGAASVETVLHCEVLRDDEVVSSATATLTRSKTWRNYTDETGGDITSTRQWALTVGDFELAGELEMDSDPGDWLGGDIAALWPDAGIFGGSFSSYSGGALVPWPGNWGSPGPVLTQSVLRFREGAQLMASTLTVGAKQMANNIVAPFVMAGALSGTYLQWRQAAATGADVLVDGLPPAVMGERAGPDVNGPAPESWAVASIERRVFEGGSYDYLHRVVLPYAGIV